MALLLLAVLVVAGARFGWWRTIWASTAVKLPEPLRLFSRESRCPATADLPMSRRQRRQQARI